MSLESRFFAQRFKYKHCYDQPFNSDIYRLDLSEIF